MVGCKADPSIERVVREGFRFPLGVYPIEDMTPKPGYVLMFESADGGEEEEWEEWPDRYVFDAVLTHERLESLCWSLFSLFPGRIYPILDVLGHDDFREIDPYVSYELMGLDRFLDSMRRYRDFFLEDGMCGFGAMTEEPFMYVFVDEHKIVTIRAQTDLKEKIERVLKAYDLEQSEDPAGADSAAHEHRSVLIAPADDTSLLAFEEIVGRLRDEWRLILNVDPTTNVDDDGRDLGVTVWRCVVRVDDEPERDPRFGEVLLAADCLDHAEETAIQAVEGLFGDGEELPDDDTFDVIIADRMNADHVKEIAETGGLSASARKKMTREELISGEVFASRWMKEAEKQA